MGLATFSEAPRHSVEKHPVERHASLIIYHSTVCAVRSNVMQAKSHSTECYAV